MSMGHETPVEFWRNLQGLLSRVGPKALMASSHSVLMEDQESAMG